MSAAASFTVKGRCRRELVTMTRPALILALLSVHNMTIEGQGGSTAERILASSLTMSKLVSLCHIRLE